MPKKNRTQIHEYLMKEGVMVVKDVQTMNNHPNVAVPNLHVLSTLKSLHSKGYVQRIFSWRHAYYRLTNDGITYLRDCLHLPSEIVPATVKQPSRATARPRAMGQRQEFSKTEGDRASYRRAGDPGADKKAEVGPGAGQMEFRGGFGRGRGMQQ